MEGFKNWLTEMAINTRHLGNWQHQKALPFITDAEDKKKIAKFKGHGWGWDDFNILTSQVGLRRITQKCSKVTADVDAYFLHSQQAGKFREVGEVQPDFLEKSLGLEIVQGPATQDLQPNQIIINPEAINVIYTQNQGTERMPWGCWTMMHRLGHALKNDRGYLEFEQLLHKELQEILEDVYGVTYKNISGSYRGLESYRGADLANEKVLRSFAYAIGTMKSCREKNLFSYFEFPHELFAQYMTQGKITFNKLPQNFGQRFAWGRPSPKHYAQVHDFDDHSYRLESLSSGLEYYIDTAINGSVGKIFVM